MRREVIGDCELRLGDARELATDIGPVDVVLTDPPYGIGFRYDGYLDNRENLSSLIHSWFPVSRFCSRALFFSNHRNLWLWPAPDWVVCFTWNTTNSYGPLGICQWQPILFYGKDVPGFGSINGQLKSDVIAKSGAEGVGALRAEQAPHPCPKPLPVMERLVARFSVEGEVVADLTCGSGTTGVACARLGRRFVGIEQHEPYFDIACRRIEAAYRQADLFIEPPPKPVQMDLSA